MRTERKRLRFQKMATETVALQSKKGRMQSHPAPFNPIRISVSYPTLVPHSSQNFAPGFRSFWQFEHFAGSCEEPQSLQNLAPA